MIEELKHIIVATSAKLTRYEARIVTHVRNRMFLTKQTKLLERLEKENKSIAIRPGSQEVNVGNGTK